MSKKKSLGHNPLAYSMMGHASFDFIAADHDAQEEDTLVEELGNDFSAHDEDRKVNKVTASYYLEEPLVERIKYIAEKREMTYSCLVTRLLKTSLQAQFGK